MLRLPKFRYLQPGSVSEAIRMMADSGPDAMFVAGGTDLYPNMKRRQQTPKVVIGLAQLNHLRTKDGEICWVAPSSPRCWAVQSSDCAPVMVAIGAKVKLVSSSGERVIPAAELYNDDGIRHLNKRPDELLTEIHLPPVNGWRATYWKLRRRGSFDFPVLGVATCLRLADDGTVEDAKIILGGVGSHPIESAASEKVLVGKKLTEETIREAAEAAYRPAKPLDNTDFAMSWRKDMARYYVAGTLRELGGLPPSSPR